MEMFMLIFALYCAIGALMFRIFRADSNEEPLVYTDEEDFKYSLISAIVWPLTIIILLTIDPD